MSFQGDLAGSGLADLLQSLARGKSGVLHLDRGRTLRAMFGLEGGMLHLLPAEGEDGETWRARARAAWADAGEDLVEGVRMTEIARARRIQALYEFLDSDTLHFRFVPGSLPRPPQSPAFGAAVSGLPEDGPSRQAVWLSPVPVEGLLLEYARLQDESGSLGFNWPNCGDSMLLRVCEATPQTDADRLHRQCDNRSTLQEMADRLGWTLHQARNVALAELQRGALRFASLEELFNALTHEFDQQRAERALARLRAWLSVSPGGPLPEMDAHMLEACWERETLQQALAQLEPRLARRLLRRMDHALGRPIESLERWAWYAAQRQGQQVAALRLVSWQLRGSADPSVPAVRDLIVQARQLLSENRPLGAAALLRIAAVRASDSVGMRHELGQCMIDAGLASEAAPLILEVLQPLVADRRWDEALPLARLLCKACPEDREARKILSRARARVMQRTLLPKRSLVWIAILGALSTAAIVQVTAARRFDQQLDDLQGMSDDPASALLALEQAFPHERDERIEALRRDLNERLAAVESRQRGQWLDEYKGAAVECTVGDILLGLKRVLELPPPPDLKARGEPLPLVSDLYSALLARLETQSAANDALEDSPEQIHAEERALPLLVAAEQATGGSKSAIVIDFAKRVTALRKRLMERGEQRANARTQAIQRENLAQQDLLINTARAHEKAGDHHRALETYRTLLATDETGRLAALLEREISVVRERCEALAEAREMALAGRHAEAHALLVDKQVPNPDARILPWRVETIPSGAQAVLPDGSRRATPFTIESAWTTVVELALETPGHESRTIRVEQPADQLIVLSRLPDRAWNAGGRIEAPPVSVGADQVVCDRGGHVARLARSGGTAWQVSLGSLGGVGRAPMLLPERPGYILALTEDGEVFVLNAATGEREGPWSCGEPPLQGPTHGPEGVEVRFRNGELYRWTSALEPVLVPPEAQGSAPASYEPSPGSDAGLAILRRRNSAATTLASPWTPYEITIHDATYVLAPRDGSSESITVRRQGDWVYVAFEAPNGAIPKGRLWISDVEGLRAFTP